MAFVLGDNFNLPIKVMTGEYEVFPAVVSKIQFIISSLRINDTEDVEKYFITGDELHSEVTYDENEGVFLFPFATEESVRFGGGFQVQARCYFGDGITLGSQVYTQTQYASLSTISLTPTTDNLLGGVVDSDGEYVGYAPYTVTVNIPQSRRVPYGIYIRYSAFADGTGFTPIPQEDTKYLGVAVGNSAPTEKEDYMWSKIFANPPTVLSSIIEYATVPVENTEYSNVFNKGMFQNQIVRTGDEFFGIWFANNSTHYAVKCKIISIVSSNLNVKVLRSVLIGNPTQTASDIAGLRSDVTEIQGDISGLESDVAGVEGDIEAIEGKIPAEASSGNKLADKAFVSSTYQPKTDNGLQTQNKDVVSAINEVNSLAKAAEKAMSFVDYEALIEYLNDASATEFNAGQIFNIQTKDVPDLWAFEVASTSVPYTYTTDDAFVTATSQSGGQQVGYYKLAQMETKIETSSDFDDLTNRPKYNGSDMTHATNIPEVKTASWDAKSTVSVSSSGTATDEVKYITINGVEKKLAGGEGTITDVQIGGTSIVSEGVATIPYSNQSRSGVIRCKAEYATATSSSGVLRADEVSYSYYQNTMHDNGFIGKATLENVIAGKNLGENIDIVVDM